MSEKQEPTVNLADLVEGRKFDGGKPRMSLLPPNTLFDTIKVLEFGAQKYAENNWMKVPDAKTRYYDALHRHIEAWHNGQTNDPETELPHLAHAACCIMFLQYLDKEE